MQKFEKLLTEKSESGNNVKNLDLCGIFDTMEESLCSSLAAFHAFTGCDYNPTFGIKAKLRLFKLLQDSPKYQNAFKQMGNVGITTDPNSMKEAFDLRQDFVCLLYRMKAVKTVNELSLAEYTNHRMKPSNLRKEQLNWNQLSFFLLTLNWSSNEKICLHFRNLMQRQFKKNRQTYELLITAGN